MSPNDHGQSEEAVQIRRLDTPAGFLDRLAHLGLELPFADAPADPATDPLAGRLVTAAGSTDATRTLEIGNRFCILPMEGWDGTIDGRPTDLVERRWRRFGASGAKLIWGGEAVAVREDGRANPHQLRIGADTVGDIARLRAALVDEHDRRSGRTDDLVVGLQLTHSGRFARPRGEPQPRTIYRHPLLDDRVGADGAHLLTDDDLDRLVDDFVAAAVLADEAGFDFVDIKHCHGYLGHELLSAVDRPGLYGGDLGGRTRFLEHVLEGIGRQAPGLAIGVRLSVFDTLPFRAGHDGNGVPEPWDGPYPYAFGGDLTGFGIDLTEPFALLDRLARLGVSMVCVTAGSPYYNPHLQRPAFFPPSDGYTPPEDPLVGVARQLVVAARLRAHRPELTMVGSAFSYLQEWLPAVARGAVARGWVDSVGLGRMALSYPDLPHDVLAGRDLDRRRICRTFSDCTTAPRNGVVSGCYPLDPHFRTMPERATVTAAKRAMAARPARATRSGEPGVAVPR